MGKKVNYVIISAEEYLRDLAVKTMREDYNEYNSLKLSKDSEKLEEFEFRIGNILEINGERLVNDLNPDDEEFNKISGEIVWGYITQIYSDGDIYIDVFFLNSAMSSIEAFVEDVFNEAICEIDYYTSNFDFIGNMQIRVDFDPETGNWVGLEEAKSFIQELPSLVKNDKNTKKVLEKYIKNDW